LKFMRLFKLAIVFNSEIEGHAILLKINHS
jgi:hypothetical protein